MLKVNRRPEDIIDDVQLFIIVNSEHVLHFFHSFFS